MHSSPPALPCAALSPLCRTEGRNELRRQVGTLRFDINALADTLPKAAKKDALAAKAEFLAAVDKLDFAMRKKNQVGMGRGGVGGGVPRARGALRWQHSGHCSAASCLGAFRRGPRTACGITDDLFWSGVVEGVLHLEFRCG